ncbi:ABC transporter substrate-binding protein [Nakamurella sp. YIM 132084]|uniref:Thiamine pyrimidine synthase n=1 Tax=Nakamurella leprariae TaxID=2803911 RepID=A0A938YKK2_9ACTN|nr:ABC transporter substrate-binding protein [Nakamurella leprariae]
MAALVLAGCGGGDSDTAAGDGTSAAPAELVPFRVAQAWISNTEYGGFWLAMDKGYYEAEGLDVEWLPGGPDAPTAESQVAADAADAGITATMNTAFAAMADDDFTVIGSVFQDNPGCYLWLADNKVETAQDLIGKTILAQTETSVLATLAVNDIPADQVTILPTGFDPAPLVNGDGDVYTAYITNQPITMELEFGLEMGTDFGCTLTGDMGLPMYASSIFAKASAIEADRENYVKFLRASQKGWQDFLADPAAGAALAVDEYGVDLGLDLEQQTRSAEAFAGLMESDVTAEHGLLYMDVDRLETEMYPALEASGVTDLPPVSEAVDLTLLDEIDAK